MDPAMKASLPPNVDRRRNYLVLIWVLFGLSTMFVSGRMYMRIFVRKVVGWDDYLICFALAIQVINNVFATRAIQSGMLIHIYYLTSVQVGDVIKWIKGIELCCIIIPVLIKLSICVSILRLVTVAQRAISVAICTLMGVLSITGIATFLVESMQCLPLRGLWQPSISAKCMHLSTAVWVLVAYGIVCGITDFICGIVPILILQKLQMDKLTKIGLCFLLGLVLVPGICSIFRTIETLSLNNPDPTWAVSGVARWVCLEIETGFMIASLPMLWSPTIAAGKSAANHLQLWREGYRTWRALRSSQLPLDSGETIRNEKSDGTSAPATRHRSTPEQHWRTEVQSKSVPMHHIGSQASLDHLRGGADGIVCRRELDVFAWKRSGQFEWDDTAVERSQNIGMSWA